MPHPHRSGERTRPTGRAVRTRSNILRELGIDLSWPVVGLTLLILAFAFGPLMLVGLFDIQGLGRNALIAAGPVVVTLAFAIMTYYFGMRHGDEIGMSRTHVWALVALFAVLGVVFGWGLFVSV